MKTKYRLVSSLSLAAALTGAVAWAANAPPPVSGAVGTVNNLGVSVGGPGAAVSGAGAFRGSAGVGGGAQNAGVFSGGGTFGGAFDSSESIGMRQERFAAMRDAAAQASVMGEARGRTVATMAASGASTSLNTAETVHAIQAGAMKSREELLAELHLRVEASAKAMAEQRKSTPKLDGEAKAHFAAASADVKAKEKLLKKSMTAAEKASAETWAESRTKLAADYDAYASAVVRVEAAGRVEAKPAKPPKS